MLSSTEVRHFRRAHTCSGGPTAQSRDGCWCISTVVQGKGLGSRSRAETTGERSARRTGVHAETRLVYCQQYYGQPAFASLPFGLCTIYWGSKLCSQATNRPQGCPHPKLESARVARGPHCLAGSVMHRKLEGVLFLHCGAWRLMWVSQAHICPVLLSRQSAHRAA